MAQQLKRWESPRKQGRNQKGRGGSARKRQLKKRHKQFLKQLKAQTRANATLSSDNLNAHSSPKFPVKSKPKSQVQILRKGKRFTSLALSFMPFLFQRSGIATIITPAYRTEILVPKVSAWVRMTLCTKAPSKSAW